MDASETHTAFHCTNALCPPCDIVSSVLCKSRNLRSTKMTCPPCHLYAASSCQVLDKTEHCHQSMTAGSPLKQQKITENFRAPERLG